MTQTHVQVMERDIPFLTTKVVTVNKHTFRLYVSLPLMPSGFGYGGENRAVDLTVVTDDFTMHHFWPSPGKFTNWWDFFAGMEADYFFKKVTNYKHEVYSPEKTKGAFLAQIIQMRKDGELTSKEAREIRDLFLPDDNYQTTDALSRMIYNHDLMHRKFHDWTDMIRNEMNPMYARFWDHVWHPYIAHLSAGATSCT